MGIFNSQLDYSPWIEKNLASFEGKQKGAKFLKPKWPHPSKLVCMHFTSTSTCINFLTPMSYNNPWFEREIWLFLKANIKEQNLQNRNGHAHQKWLACILCQPLLAWIVWADSIFWPPWTIMVHGLKGNFGQFWRQTNLVKSLKPERPYPPKLVCMHISSTSTCMNFWADSIIYWKVIKPAGELFQ